MIPYPSRFSRPLLGLLFAALGGTWWFSTRNPPTSTVNPSASSSSVEQVPQTVNLASRVNAQTQPTATPSVVPQERCAVSGRVVDEHNRPLANATVLLFATSVLRALQVTHTSTDGTFELLGLPVAQTLELRAKAPGFRSKRIEVRLDQPGAELERTLTLREGQTLAGHVVDSEGNPVAGARIGSSDNDSSGTHSSETGTFTLQGLPNEPVNVFAQAQGFATRHVREVTPGQSTLKLILERPATIQGSVKIPSTVTELLVSACHLDVDFNKELCLARQLLRHPSAQYRLEGLPSGNYDLVVEAAGYPDERKTVVAIAGQEQQGPALDPTQ